MKLWKIAALLMGVSFASYASQTDDDLVNQMKGMTLGEKAPKVASSGDGGDEDKNKGHIPSAHVRSHAFNSSSQGGSRPALDGHVHSHRRVY